MLVLPWADQLDRMASGAQAMHQPRERDGHAIDFGRPSFGDHGNAQRLCGGQVVFYQDAIAFGQVHAGMVVWLFNGLMTEAAFF